MLTQTMCDGCEWGKGVALAKSRSHNLKWVLHLLQVWYVAALAYLSSICDDSTISHSGCFVLLASRQGVDGVYHLQGRQQGEGDQQQAAAHRV